MPKEKVLIVDDEIDVLDLCKRILENQGYEVRSAHNGYEAIEIAKNEQFDLLLTDIKMPGMNGLEIAQALKQSDPGIICVTMTGFSTMDMAINAVKLGINEFILKPFTPAELSKSIAKALEKERLRKENFRLRSLIPLFELNRTLMGTVEMDNLLKRLIEIASEETRASFAALYIIGERETKALFRYKEGEAAPEAQKETSKQVCELVTKNGAQLILNASQVDNEQHVQMIEQLKANAVIGTPLKSKANLGALILTHTENEFAPSDSEFLSVLCGQASIALENARLFSEIQEAYEQLQILDHMKSEFINIAAHELRTPLAILMGYASVLEEETEPSKREYISNIMRNAMRLRTLIDDMLNLQYLESGIGILAQDMVHLPETIEQITQDVSLLVEEKQLHVKNQILSDFPEMIIDRKKFDLILMNLVHNAVKFTPAGGCITFQAEVVGEQVQISVNNTGITIPQEKLDRIFDRFYQVESSLTREHGGAGLGLAIVRGMVAVCGGTISVESSDEAGTTFTLTLPLDNTDLEARRLELS
jgi:signal transduction histidine kinase/CheY-like chemotaxis protein